MYIYIIIETYIGMYIYIHTYVCMYDKVNLGYLDLTFVYLCARLMLQPLETQCVPSTAQSMPVAQCSGPKVACIWKGRLGLLY